MTSTFKKGLCAAALAALAACQTGSAHEAPSVQPFDPLLTSAAEQSRAPSVVAAVYRNGHLAEVYAWGGADCDGAGAVNAFADFEIGSISKQMTAVGLLKLWERGRVDLDASLGTYLADTPEAWRRVTLRQLLTHTSGVPDYEEAGGYGVYETTPTPQQVYDIVRDRPLDFEPGTRWSYSNTGYFLLSLVIERVSDMRFGDYMRENVFEPAGMPHTFVSGYAPPDAVIAQGCKPGEDGARVPVRPIAEASTFGAGGILSTVQDWAAWDAALHGGRLLSERSMREMFTPTVLPNGENTGYAFGIEVDDFRGEPRRGHSGQTQGFVADYAHFPERGVSFLVLTNRYGSGTRTIMQTLELRAMPDLSYDRLTATQDPDPARTARVRRAIRQMILGEEPPFDLLSADLKSFPTDPRTANSRERLHDIVTDMARLDYLRDEPRDGAFDRFLYRVTRANGDQSYFVVSWDSGILVGLRWFDE